MALHVSTETLYNNNKSTQIISDEEHDIFIVVNHCTLNFTVALFGVVANTLNIIVFLKQGFKNTINISLFGLTISDLCSLLAMVWFIVCLNPLLVKSNTFMVTPEIQHLTAGIPHICFVRITGWITVFVTAERCLCITMPLKIKQIITPRVTKIAICFIYICIFLSFVPEYEISYIDWKFYPGRNKTLLGLVFRSNKKDMEGLGFFLYAILGFVSFIAVIVFTVLLVVQLKQKSRWRSQANADRTRSETISNRDTKTVKMVVIIAVVLIVCYTPGVIISVIVFLVSEFSILGAQSNAFFVSWSFAFSFQAVNSSVNIFVYYRMSTNYRETFNGVFGFSRFMNVVKNETTVSENLNHCRSLNNKREI